MNLAFLFLEYVMVCRSCLHRFKNPASNVLQEMAWQMKGTVEKCDHREYGFAQVQISKIGGENASVDALFEGLGDEMQVRRREIRQYSRSNL